MFTPSLGSSTDLQSVSISEDECVNFQQKLIKLTHSLSLESDVKHVECVHVVESTEFIIT